MIRTKRLLFLTLLVSGCFVSGVIGVGRVGAQTSASSAAVPRAAKVARWTRFEAHFESSGAYDNPAQDVRVEVEFTSPGGAKRNVFAFWDGGKNWKVRFAPGEAGRWSYVTRSSNAGDRGLHEQRGAFACVAYGGRNELYRRGPLRPSADRYYLTHADNHPFFWLGDTAWNGALLADKNAWQTFLRDRVGKGFTAIKFVTTQWRTATGDADNRVAFTGKEKIVINPEFYRRMDERFDAVNEHGLIAAPVLLWAIRGEENPGWSLPEDQAILLARYMVARYGAHHVVWLLGGDGDYRGEKAEKWKRIGRAVFGERPAQPVTMHMGGRHWVADEFRDEKWYGFHGYQSGHGDTEATWRWTVEGPPGRSWQKTPVHPSINLEPNYEAHNGGGSRKPFDAHAVRRAAYWSLLVTPPAGVSYGAHGIWSWQREAGEPLNHKGTGIAAPWHEAMNLPGSLHMKHLRALFESVEWWRLRPAQELLVEQPGKTDARRFVAIAKSNDGKLALAYLPEGGTIALRLETFNRIIAARWVNPRGGGWQRAKHVRIGASDAPLTFAAPDTNDWVLWVNFKERRRRYQGG